MRERVTPVSDESKPPITQILGDVRSGDRKAVDRLMAVVYDELQKLAAAAFKKEGGQHTLQPTALINEAWLKFGDELDNLENRRHLFGAAARAMRQVLIDHARRRDRKKRGGNNERVELDPGLKEAGEKSIDVLVLDDALRRLGEIDEGAAKVAEMRFFVGLSVDEAAQAIGCSNWAAAEDWRTAKAWLREALAD